LVFFSAILVFNSAIFAQNLVPNGSFEVHDTLPYSYAQWDFCQSWSNVNENTVSNQAATPDYYHINGSGGYQLPFSTRGTVYPHHGNAVMGILGLHPLDNWREYVSAKLTEPLLVGTDYQVSYWITNGEEGFDYKRACDGMGLQLTENPVNQNTSEQITPNSYDFIIDSIIWNTTWLQVSYNFTADSAYEYITIGSYFSPTSISSVEMDTSGYIDGAYYFIDDVELICTDDLCYVPSVIEMPNIFTPNGDFTNETFQPVVFEEFENYSIVIVNRWGDVLYNGTNPNYGWDGNYSGEKCSEGVYHWLIKYETLDGLSQSKNGFMQLVR
jgi:gliding motility-associated-like protein